MMLSKLISKLDSHADRCGEQVLRINEKLIKIREKQALYKQIVDMFPNATLSNYPTIGAIIDPNVPADKFCISRSIIKNAISYSTYLNVSIGNDTVRVFKFEQQPICLFQRDWKTSLPSGISYSFGNYIQAPTKVKIKISFKESSAWLDPDCKAKIKSAYKYLMKTASRSDELEFEGLEHAPTYIKMMNNFK